MQLNIRERITDLGQRVLNWRDRKQQAFADVAKTPSSLFENVFTKWIGRNGRLVGLNIFDPNYTISKMTIVNVFWIMFFSFIEIPNISMVDPKKTINVLVFLFSGIEVFALIYKKC